METDRIAPALTVNGSKSDASDGKPSEAPKGASVGAPAAQRRLNRRPILGVGLLALIGLSAVAYFFWAWDASREIINRSNSSPAASTGTHTATAQQTEKHALAPSSPAPATTPAPGPAPLPATTPAPAATAAPAATPAPAPAAAPATEPTAIAAAPRSSGSASEPTARQAPPAAAQAPINGAPVAEPAPAPPTSMQQQPASLPKEGVVFVQKPGVRIRSEPNRRGRVIGSATKGDQFKVVGRSGSWVQVEGDAGSGWIGSRMLGSESP